MPISRLLKVPSPNSSILPSPTSALLSSQLMHACRSRRVCRAYNAFQPSQALQQIFPSISRHLTISASRRNDTHANSSKDGVMARLRPQGLTPEIIAANVRQSKDIHPEDLSATLEAHRTSNAAYADQLAQSEPSPPFSPSPAATKKDISDYSKIIRQVLAHPKANAREAAQDRHELKGEMEGRPVHFHIDFDWAVPEESLQGHKDTDVYKAWRRRKFVEFAIASVRKLYKRRGISEPRPSNAQIARWWVLACQMSQNFWQRLPPETPESLRNRMQKEAAAVARNNTDPQAFIKNRVLEPIFTPSQCLSLWNLYKASQRVGELRAPVMSQTDAAWHAQDDVLSYGSTKNLSPDEKRLLQKKDKDVSQIREYTGIPIQPIIRRAVAAHKQPWFVPMSSKPGESGYDMDPVNRLDLEISGLHTFLLPNRAQRAARSQVTEDTVRLIKRTLRYTETETFGSVRTGLATACSDVDIRVYQTINEHGWDPAKASRQAQRTAMSQRLEAYLHQALCREGEYMLVNFRHARYPLITAQHRDSGLDLQIVGADDSSLSRDCIKKYLEMYPGLHELYNVVKSMFDVRGLMDVFRGGLASYTVFMMVASIYRFNENASANKPAQNLLEFLSFWSKFDTYKHGVSLEPPLIFEKKKSTSNKQKQGTRRPKGMADDVALEKGLEAVRVIDRPQPYLLCLQDPADPFNDLSHKTFAIKHIQATLAAIYDKLVLQMSLNDPDACLLDAVVGPVFTKYYPQHKKLEEYGERLLANPPPAKSDEVRLDTGSTSSEQPVGESGPVDADAVPETTEQPLDQSEQISADTQSEQVDVDTQSEPGERASS